MNNHTQFIKNIDLSEKLARFIAKNSDKVKNLPEDASFVTFSAEDQMLNNANSKLIKGLLKKGLNVIKAEETKDKHNPWKFTPLISH